MLQTVKIKNMVFLNVLTFLVLKRVKTVELFFVFLVHRHTDTQTFRITFARELFFKGAQPSSKLG